LTATATKLRGAGSNFGSVETRLCGQIRAAERYVRRYHQRGRGAAESTARCESTTAGIHVATTTGARGTARLLIKGVSMAVGIRAPPPPKGRCGAAGRSEWELPQLQHDMARATWEGTMTKVAWANEYNVDGEDSTEHTARRIYSYVPLTIKPQLSPTILLKYTP